MALQKPEVKIRSFGIYSKWDADSKQLPRIEAFTTEIPAVVDIEFGLIVNIKGAKNRQLEYCIYHPGIPDDQGNPRPPFDSGRDVWRQTDPCGGGIAFRFRHSNIAMGETEKKGIRNRYCESDPDT